MSEYTKAITGKDASELVSIAQVQAMVTNANCTAANQWETYSLTYSTGWTCATNWCLNKMMVNKHTGAVTGVLGSYHPGTDSCYALGICKCLGIHPSMRIHYPDMQVYTTIKAISSVSDRTGILTRDSSKNLNICLDSDGCFRYQGEPTISCIATHISNLFYIGNKYGSITTTDIEPAVVLPEGQFYTQNTAALLTGKSWFRYDITLPTGYDISKSVATIYKNLWSGEAIFQYSLYPTTTGSFPAITVPARYNGIITPFFMKPRYISPSTANTNAVLNKEYAYMLFSAGKIQFGGIPSYTTWITGSNFYMSTVETGSYLADGKNTSVITLKDDGAVSLAGTDYSNLDTAIKANPAGCSCIAGSSMAGYYTACYSWRGTYGTFMAKSKTGMVYENLDMTTTNANFGAPTKALPATYRPSIKYRWTNASMSVYHASPVYTQKIRNGYGCCVSASDSPYTANLFISTNNVAGGTATCPGLSYGTTGNISNSSDTLVIWQGWFLADNT